MRSEKLASKIEAAANRYISLYGLSVIPIAEDGKKPVVKWKEYQSRFATKAEIASWRGSNLGIVTGRISGIAVIDCESEENARWFWENRGGSSMYSRSTRGYHFFFRLPPEGVQNGTHIACEKGISRYDVRGEGGYVLAPPSWTGSHQYAWHCGPVPTCNLPVFDNAWRQCQRAVPENSGEKLRIKTESAAISFISKIRAVSGQAGSKDTWRAVNRLKDSGMSEAETMAAILDWNQTNAEPPWSKSELAWKVTDAYRRG